MTVCIFVFQTATNCESVFTFGVPIQHVCIYHTADWHLDREINVIRSYQTYHYCSSKHWPPSNSQSSPRALAPKAMPQNCLPLALECPVLNDRDESVVAVMDRSPNPSYFLERLESILEYVESKYVKVCHINILSNFESFHVSKALMDIIYSYTFQFTVVPPAPNISQTRVMATLLARSCHHTTTFFAGLHKPPPTKPQTE